MVTSLVKTSSSFLHAEKQCFWQSVLYIHLCSYTLLLCLWIDERTWNKLMYLFLNLYLLFFFIVHCSTNNKKWRKNRNWNYALNVNKTFLKRAFMNYLSSICHHILDYYIKKNCVSKNYFLYKYLHENYYNL